MVIEYKSVDVVGVSEVKDEGDGVVTAYVSVTGVEDNVKDVIEPGAYTRTLNKRTPKGVWGHQWLTPTSKTLEVKELMPGDPDLPKELADKTPWPKNAGALKIKMQFNLDTRRGREAYSDVRFFDDQQEWSIGYTVPPNGAYKDAKGVRHIKDLDLFEYSAVLFGAMSHARTASVKDAQVGMKLLEGVSALEIKSLEDAVAQYRKDNGVDTGPDVDETEFVGDEDDETDADDNVDDEEVDEEELDDDAEEEKSFADLLASSLSIKELRGMYTSIGKVLDAVNSGDSGTFLELGYKALIEAKATGYDTIADAVDAIDVNLDPSDAKAMKDAAEKLDFALKSNDSDAAEESAGDLMDILEKAMDDNPDQDFSLKTVARTIADKAGGTEEEEDEEDDDEDYEKEDWEDEDDEEEGKEKKSCVFVHDGIEYKNAPRMGRRFGYPQGGEDLDVKTRQRAFVCGLPNRALLALDHVVRQQPGNMHIKSVVSEEIEDRMSTGLLTEEEKNYGGQDGRGGGRHVQAAEGRTPGSGRNFGETGRAAKPSGKRLKKAAKGLKKPGTSKKTLNRVTGRKKPVSRMTGAESKNGGGRLETKVVAIDTTELKSLETYLDEIS